MKDHPEIFTQSDGVISKTQAIYQAAFDSMLSRPHLLAFGYVKGLAHYFADLFKFAHDFKPLRFLLFTPLWMAGVWFAVKRWREPRYALLLWLQAGILVSSPFITFDGGNRVYAATVPLDALFVGLGVIWTSTHMESKPEATIKHIASVMESAALALVGIAIVLVPISTQIAIRLGNAKMVYVPPICENGLDSVIIRPGRSTLQLPLVSPGEETVFPLRVRANHLAKRLHKTVHNAFEFHHEPGTTLVWGVHLDSHKFGEQVFFLWKGEELTAGNVVGLCIRRPEDPRSNIGIATARRYTVPNR